MHKLIFILLVSLGVKANADAVSDSLERAMGECVSLNSARIGSPVADPEIWSRLIRLGTVHSLSTVNLFGTDKHEDVLDVMILRTRDLLISLLEDTGIEGFRSKLIETLEYCMPFALIAAVEERERQANKFCPDDTAYVKAVKILTSTEDELYDRFGDKGEEALGFANLQVRLKFMVFKETFKYGNDGYPEFTGSGAIRTVHEALTKIDSGNIANIQPFVVQALEGVRNVDNKSERLVELERELICIQDWLDIFPADAMNR